MRFILSFFLLLVSVTLTAQPIDTLKYFLDLNKAKSHPGYEQYYRVAFKENGIWHVKDYFLKERSLQMDGTYTDDSLKNAIGTFYWYHNNRQMAKKGRYIDGKKEGMWKEYWESGNPKDSTLFKNNEPYKFSYKWHDNGKVAMIGIYDDDGAGIDTGWNKEGVIDFYGRYGSGNIKDGAWVYYYRNGRVASKEHFRNDSLVKMECFTELGMMDNCDVDIVAYRKSH